MPVEERRQALITATVPLIHQHGTNVTTKQIAEAAGVAEGTIFRVFDTKNDLLVAVAETIFDTSKGEAALRAIDPALPLDEKLVRVVRGMRTGITKANELMQALGHAWMNEHMAHRVKENVHVKVYGKLLAELVRPHEDELRLPADNLHSLVFAVVFSTFRPEFYGGSPPSPEQLVSFLLDGVRVHPASEVPVPNHDSLSPGVPA